MIEWYYILGIISYTFFIIQFICSLLGSEIDFDIDFDADTDFDGGDIFSFKGLLHFLLGFSTYLMVTDTFVTHDFTALTYIIAVGCGMFTTLVLYFSYKACLKFNHENTSIGDICGNQGTIYLVLNKSNVNINECMYTYVVTVNINGGTIEINALSNNIYKKGDSVIIKEKDSLGNYII